MEEIQGRPPAKDGQALDLRSSSADVDHGRHRSENDNDSEENWDKTMSGGEDSSMDHQRIGGSSDMDHETNGDGGGGGGHHALNTSSIQDTPNGGAKRVVTRGSGRTC